MPTELTNTNCKSNHYFSKQKKLYKSEKTKFLVLIHENGNFSEWKDSLAYCISSEFKMSARIAQNFQRKFLYNFSESTNSPLFVQRVEEEFIYHSITKKRLFRKPTSDSFRQSPETTTNHPNEKRVASMSMSKAGCRLDRLERHKVERLIKEVCAEQT